MKLAVKKMDTLKRELKFEVPQERVTEKLEEVFKDLGKVAKVRGFRQGKVPRNVLEKEHGELAREEMIKKLIPEVYQEGIEQEKIFPLDLPEVLDVSFKEGVLKFTAQLEIRPEVKVGHYKGLKVKRKSSQVTDEEINKTLDYFKESQGKDKKMEIDDEFVKGLGYPSLEAFKQSLARQMEMDKDRQNRIDVENQIVEAVLKDSKLAVPKEFVKKQIEMRVHQAKERMAQQGVAEADIGKREEEMRKTLKVPVEKEVKVYLIFEKIAEQEKISVAKGENMVAKVMELLLKEASWEESQEKESKK